jgi:hypothetical protein
MVTSESISPIPIILVTSHERLLTGISNKFISSMFVAAESKKAKLPCNEPRKIKIHPMHPLTTTFNLNTMCKMSRKNGNNVTDDQTQNTESTPHRKPITFFTSSFEGACCRGYYDVAGLHHSSRSQCAHPTILESG